MRMSYPHWIQFQGQRLGLVWQTDDEAGDEGETDGVLAYNGQIVWARTEEEFSELASLHNLTLEAGNEEPQNLDGIEELLQLPASDDTCAQLLNAWNLLGDIARSVNASLDDRGSEADKCYDKLFYGNNLPSITPPGEHYSPYFDDHEQRVITEILDRGRVILKSRLDPRATTPGN
ncbi:hypothetical protein [Arthrobacter globiformis]|uniref:hypothetical protein n=1 Tax=Arthrobacter globiformis TaxID=1665 RepID=UPI00397B7455